MNEYQLFKMGFKSAIYDTILSSLMRDYLAELRKEYPYINKGIGLIPETTTYMFFQNEELKVSFEERVAGVKVDSYEFHRILGYALGYPPKAVDFFVRCLQEPGLEHYKVGMHYMGVSCNGSIDDLVENCHWLWDTYTIPDIRKLLEVRIGYNFYSVDYKDVDRLRELQELALSTVAVTTK